MKFLSKKSLLTVALLAAVSSSAFAAQTGTEFQNLYNLLVGWATGYLGKALAIGAFIVGAAIGFSKGTAMPALVGIVFAIVLGIGPGIIDGMMTALI
jgi:conjugal transfer pilus assembly protein TraA